MSYARWIVFAALCSCSSGARPAAPEVKVWGSLRAIVHEGRTESRVAISSLLTTPHLYAIGAVAEMRGEITIVDGTAWLSIGARDSGRATSGLSDEGATLLVAASVSDWRRVTITEDIPFAELDRRIEAYAVAAGLDVEKPFPFVIDGELADVRWHVLVGPPSNPGAHDHARNAVQGEHATLTAIAVGFFSKHHQGVFTHMKHNVHAHVVDGKGLAAHADQFSIRKGSTLRIPK